MKKHTKRMLSILLAAALSAVSMAGCSASSSGKDSSGATDQVKLNFWRAGTDAETQAYWDAMIARFEEKHPGVTVTLSSLPWGDEIETKLNAAYASGTAPDVLNYSAISIPQRASVGQYAALDSYLENWEVASDIFQSVIDYGKYENKLYGLGFRPDARMFVWRKDMFEAAGLDPEVPPTNWEELREFADRLTIKKNGTTVQGGYSLAMANGFQDFQLYLMQNGGDFIDLETGKLTYNSPEAIEALDFLNGMVQAGNVIPSDNFQSGTDAFLSGKAAMAYKNVADIRGMILADPSLNGKIGIRAPLEHKVPSTFSGMGFMFMSEDSKHKDLAWEFIKMTMSPEEFHIRSEELNVPPVLESLKEEYIAKDPVMNQVVIDSIKVGRGAYPVIFSNQLNEKVSSAIEQVYYGKKTSAEALNESVEAFQKEIDAMN